MSPAPDHSTARTGVLLEEIRGYRGPAVSIMEVCGTHTVAIARMGLRGLLPEGVTLLSGPGCPVCVTPVETFDAAIHLTMNCGVTLATYGDGLRVPGSHTTLAAARAEGGSVLPVYSAMDALSHAKNNPAREVVFLGLGFETTSPTVAHAVMTAKAQGVGNFSVLCAHKALMPAMEVLSSDPSMKIGAYLCPGHASMVLGSDSFLELCSRFRIPCVVAGFGVEDVLLGVSRILRQTLTGEARVENCYPAAVTPEGNPSAKAALNRVFTLTDSRWRGLGELPGSGYGFREEYAEFDAAKKFLAGISFEGREPPGCRCAEVLRGITEPARCPLFAVKCTPENPVGACMVSGEGACGAHYRYRGVS